MNDGFFDVKLLFDTPQSFHDSSPQGGALKASPLGEVARSDGVAAKRTPRHCPLRSECDFRATDDRPYNTTQKRATDDRPYELHIFLYQPHLQSASLEGS